MKLAPYLLLACLGIAACQNAIKNTEHPVEVEAGTDTATVSAVEETAPSLADAKPSTETPSDALLGYWVGYFEVDRKKVKDYDVVAPDDGFYWDRQNKINISIDRIVDDSVSGHSVVAGNDRPFAGTVEQVEGENGSTIYRFEVREPGDDRYDGVFRFEIADGKMTGTWEAYNDLEIKYRKYDLAQRLFAYDPSIGLEPSREFMDWGKYTETEEEFDYGEGEMETWVYREFASATPVIYDINASARLLSREEVANLKRGDLLIIRNTIYARHGYSFKNRPLRVFFDAQPWYIPVHADIRGDFTDIEMQNIELLLTFEKNAAEYYDRFGRG